MKPDQRVSPKGPEIFSRPNFLCLESGGSWTTCYQRVYHVYLQYVYHVYLQYVYAQVEKSYNLSSNATLTSSDCDVNTSSPEYDVEQEAQSVATTVMLLYHVIGQPRQLRQPRHTSVTSTTSYVCHVNHVIRQSRQPRQTSDIGTSHL